MAGATKSGLGVPAAGASERHQAESKNRRGASRADESAHKYDELEDQPGGLGPDQRPPSDS